MRLASACPEPGCKPALAVMYGSARQPCSPLVLPGTAPTQGVDDVISPHRRRDFYLARVTPGSK